MSRLATTQVIGRPRGTTSIIFASSPVWALKGMSVMSPYSEGSFYAQESKGDLTLDHYLNSPPIEPSLKEFSHNRKIPRWSGWDSNPRLRAQRQACSPLSHQTTLPTTK